MVTVLVSSDTMTRDHGLFSASLLECQLVLSQGLADVVMLHVEGRSTNQRQGRVVFSGAVLASEKMPSLGHGGCDHVGDRNPKVKAASEPYSCSLSMGWLTAA